MDFLCRTWAEIDIKAVIDNCRRVKEICGKDVYAVVKADGYGHGAVKVALALCEAKAVLGFAVSNIIEAEELREAGIDSPILILGYTPVEVAKKLADLDVAQCVFSLEYAQALSDKAVKHGFELKCHLKLDTGMGRIGFDCRDASLTELEKAKKAVELKGLNFEGVFTHFAVADGIAQDERDFTKQQYERFLSAVNLLEQGGMNFKYKHCGNSAATLSLNMPETNCVRAGIVLYGLTPDVEFPFSECFKPAMSLYSVVSEVKTVKKGETVAYGRTYVAPNERKIATVSAGYADGVPRLLSNKGKVIINGKEALIVGRICMDQFCVDVTDIDNVKPGDKVTIFGKGLPVEYVAELAETINYEIVCGISKRVPRTYN